MQFTSSGINSPSLLPEELQVAIFRYLSPSELCIVSKVCKLWKQITEDDSLWKEKTHELWVNADNNYLPIWKQVFRLQYLYRKATPVLFAHEYFYVGYNKSLFLWLNRIPHRTPIFPVFFTEHTAPITAIHRSGYSPESHRIVTASADGTIRLWREEERLNHVPGQQQKELICRSVILGHKEPITSLLVRRKWIVIGSADSSISIWENDAANDVILNSHYLTKHTDEITALQEGQDDGNGFIFYSASRDKTIRVWRLTADKQARCLQTVKLNNDTITCFSRTISDKYLYSGTTNKTILIWEINQLGELKDGKPVQTLYGHEKPVTCLHLIRFSIYFISGSEDGTVKIWKRDPSKNEWSLAEEICPTPTMIPISQLYIQTHDPLRHSKKLFVTCKNNEIFVYNCAPLPSFVRLIQTLKFKELQ